jgi:transcriptional regulator with XRE-family HTH domain
MKMQTKLDLREALLVCRTDHQLTLDFIGQRIGITKAAVAAIERGISRPRRTTRLRLVRFLAERGYAVKEEAA